jgi:hypothetical protein
MSVPRWRDEEQATQPDSPKRTRPPGCTAFSSLRRCSSSVIPRLRDGYAPSSRLGETKNRQEHGMAEFFNRLLRFPNPKTQIPDKFQARNVKRAKPDQPLVRFAPLWVVCSETRSLGRIIPNPAESRKTTRFIRKCYWILSIVIVALSPVASVSARPPTTTST